MPSTIAPTLANSTADQQQQKELTPNQIKRAAREAEKKAKREEQAKQKAARMEDKERMTEMKERTAEQRQLEKDALKKEPKPAEVQRIAEEQALFAEDIDEGAEFAKQERHTKKSKIESNRLGDALHMA
jgi:hypothetical protein